MAGCNATPLHILSHIFTIPCFTLWFCFVASFFSFASVCLRLQFQNVKNFYLKPSPKTEREDTWTKPNRRTTKNPNKMRENQRTKNAHINQVLFSLLHFNTFILGVSLQWDNKGSQMDDCHNGTAKKIRTKAYTVTGIEIELNNTRLNWIKWAKMGKATRSQQQCYGVRVYNWTCSF